MYTCIYFQTIIKQSETARSLLKSGKTVGNDQWKIHFMNERIDVVHQTAESGLSPKEAKDILWFSASNWSFLIGFFFFFLYLYSV